jgi:hypothetical protein
VAFISETFEAFLKLVFYYDIKSLPQIDSSHLQVTDPLIRNNIRQSNQAQTQKKYFPKNGTFSLRDFVKMGMNISIENIEKKVIISREKLRLNLLKLILKMFEVGLWRVQDLQSLLEFIHIKINVIKQHELQNKSEATNRSWWENAHRKHEQSNAHKHTRSCEPSAQYSKLICSILNHAVLIYNDDIFNVVMNPAYKISERFTHRPHVETLKVVGVHYCQKQSTKDDKK